MIGLQNIRDLHRQYWRKGYGSISANEANYIQMGVSQYKPRRFIEIGTASGLSAGFIGLFMHENGGGELVTIDLDETFWVDRSKETGFLARDICPHDSVDFRFLRGQNSLCIEGCLSEQKFDMAFVDANHQHPWPTLDMICLLPAMVDGALIYHHDLALYKKQDPIFGIGPKYLYDQIPDALKNKTGESAGNIFFVKVPENYIDLQSMIIDSLFLPWTIRSNIAPTAIQGFCEIAEKHWSQDVVDAIQETAKKFNLDSP